MRWLNSVKQMALYQFRSMFRNKMAFFFSLMMPLVLLFVFGSMYRPETVSRTAVGWVDLDHGAVSQALRTAMEKSGQYNLVSGDDAALQKQLSQGDLKALLRLPSGLSVHATSNQGPGQIAILFDPTSQTSAGTVAALQQMIGAVDMALKGTAPGLVVKAEELSTVAHLNVFDFLVPGQLVNMLLSAGLITVAMTVVSQRQTGVLRHMFSTPLSVSAWMAARIAANLMMAALQVCVLYAAAVAIFQIHLPGNLPGTILVLILSSLVTVGMGLSVGTLAKSPEAANPVAMICYMAMLFLGNAMMPIETAPAAVQTLSHFMPSYYMTHALRLVMMQGKGIGEAALDLAILAAFAAVVLGLGAWRMRRQYATT